MAAVLPINPDTTNKATAGREYTLYVNTGTAILPTWVKVGGQRNSPLNQSADEIDVSSKSSGGYGATIPGIKKWDISLDALAISDDPGIVVVEQAYDESAQLNIKFERPDLKAKIGWCTVTEFSLDVGHDAEATISGTLNGVGPLTAWALEA